MFKLLTVIFVTVIIYYLYWPQHVVLVLVIHVGLGDSGGRENDGIRPVVLPQSVHGGVVYA